MANVFIGSSNEARAIAEVVADVLKELGAGTTGWWYLDTFRPGETIIGGIERLAHTHDAALLIATADDRTAVRGQEHVKPRDNLIFEAGYFMGQYGRHRAPIARVGSPRLPTDLNGVIYLTLPLPTNGLTRYREDVRPILRVWLEGLSGSTDAQTPPHSKLLPYKKDAPRWRLATSDRLIDHCKPRDLVRFIAVTGYALFAREPRQADRLIFVEALKRGVRFRGVVMNPGSVQADLRGGVETPGVPRTARLFDRDAKGMQEWLSGGYCARITDEQRRNIEVKQSDGLISFGLLMFDEVAFIEPLHLGKLDNLEHLCGFSIIEAPRGSHDYDVVRRHFDLLFDQGTPI
jgi:hypothetical protein